MPFPDSPDPVFTPPPEGMVLGVTHLTRFRYKGHVTESHNEVRLCPISDPLQRCFHFDLRITPEVRVVIGEDFYQNRVDYFDVEEPHDVLEIESHARVQTRAEMRGPVPSGLSLASLDAPEVDVNIFDFQNSSPLIDVNTRIAEAACTVIGPEVTDLWSNGVELARHVYRTFEYVPGATHVYTRVHEAWETRRGVCQDFANVTIALGRSRGIPTRYVSGYFFNGKTEDHEVEASHAWVEFYVPGYGWKGFDPTHDREVDARYIKVAVGRDYSDAQPVNGRFLGLGTQQMDVEVRVRELPAGA